MLNNHNIECPENSFTGFSILVLSCKKDDCQNALNDHVNSWRKGEKGENSFLFHGKMVVAGEFSVREKENSFHYKLFLSDIL